MARKLRVEYPSAVYHVLSRGDCREVIFKDDYGRMGSWSHVGNLLAKTKGRI